MLKKVFRKKIVVLVSCIVAILITSIFSVQLFANYMLYAYKLNGGVGHTTKDPRLYCIDPSCTQYQTYIDTSWSRWIHTGSFPGIVTPIYYQKTNNKSYSVCDFYADNAYDGPMYPKYIADTKYYSYTSYEEVHPWLQNWDYCKVYIHTPHFKDLSDFDKYGTCAHEIGHSMGLEDASDSQYVSPKEYTMVVMSQLGGPEEPDKMRKVNRPQMDDCKGINVMYGSSSAAATSMSFSANSPQLSTTVVEGTETIPTLPRMHDLAKIYHDTNSLNKDSQIVIEGTVLQKSYFDEFLGTNCETYTKSTIRVDKCLLGSKNVGENLTFIEMGGVTTKYNLVDRDKNPKFVPSEDLKKQKVYVCDYGVPISKVGDKVLLFANEESNNVTSGTYCYITGGYQGKFNISGAIAERKGPYSIKSNVADLENTIK